MRNAEFRMQKYVRGSFWRGKQAWHTWAEAE